MKFMGFQGFFQLGFLWLQVEMAYQWLLQAGQLVCLWG